MNASSATAFSPVAATFEPAPAETDRQTSPSPGPGPRDLSGAGATLSALPSPTRLEKLPPEVLELLAREIFHQQAPTPSLKGVDIFHGMNTPLQMGFSTAQEAQRVLRLIQDASTGQKLREAVDAIATVDPELRGPCWKAALTQLGHLGTLQALDALGPMRRILMGQGGVILPSMRGPDFEVTLRHLLTQLSAAESPRMRPRDWAVCRDTQLCALVRLLADEESSHLGRLLPELLTQIVASRPPAPGLRNLLLQQAMDLAPQSGAYAAAVQAAGSLPEPFRNEFTTALQCARLRSSKTLAADVRAILAATPSIRPWARMQILARLVQATRPAASNVSAEVQADLQAAVNSLPPSLQAQLLSQAWFHDKQKGSRLDAFLAVTRQLPPLEAAKALARFVLDVRAFVGTAEMHAVYEGALAHCRHLPPDCRHEVLMALATCGHYLSDWMCRAVGDAASRQPAPSAMAVQLELAQQAGQARGFRSLARRLATAPADVLTAGARVLGNQAISADVLRAAFAAGHEDDALKLIPSLVRLDGETLSVTIANIAQSLATQSSSHYRPVFNALLELVDELPPELKARPLHSLACLASKLNADDRRAARWELSVEYDALPKAMKTPSLWDQLMARVSP